MTSTDVKDFPNGAYIPGLAGRKAGMILFGILVFAVGFWLISTPLWLVVFGEKATAEATDVVKVKPGLPDLVLHDDAQIQAHLETRDRSYVFWNEFTFQTADGRAITTRANVGSQLKPLYPLLDADGLPTTDVVYYDPAHPEVVIFSKIISTWFAPGFLLFVGTLATVIGATLYYWATKPIALPHIPTQKPAP